MLPLFFHPPDIKVKSFITLEQWRQHWSSSKEQTSSSISGCHFGHHIVISQDMELGFILISLINLSVKNQSILDHWEKGLSIMLLKKENTIRVEKLRAILLLEADFNAIAKILFNTRVMPLLEQNQLIPPENIGSHRNMSAVHSTLTRQFFLDTANLRCKPSVIISADATNCFD